MNDIGDIIGVVLIVVGILGAIGTLCAIACGYVVHRSEQIERDWWDRREREWRDGQ